MLKRLIDVMVAGGASQLFWYLSLPFVSRLYSASDIGQYGKYLAYSGVVSILIGVRSDIAILAAEENSLPRVVKAFNGLASLLLLMSAFVLCFSYFFFESAKKDFDFFVLVLMGAASTYAIKQDTVLFIKMKHESSLKWTSFFRSFIQSFSQCVFFFVPYSLIAGRIFAEIITVVLRCLDFKRKGNAFNSLTGVFSFSHFTDVKCIVFDKKEGFVFVFFQSLLNAASQYLPYFILPGFVGSAWLGHYTLAFSIIVLPIGLLSGPLRQLLLRDFVSIGHDESKKKVIRFTFYLFSIALFLYGVFFIFLDWALQVFLGSIATVVSPLVMTLLPWSLAGLMNAPAIAFILARKKNKIFASVEFFTFLGRCLTLLAGSLFPEFSIVPFVLWNVLSNFVLIWVAVR